MRCRATRHGLGEAVHTMSEFGFSLIAAPAFLRDLAIQSPGFASSAWRYAAVAVVAFFFGVLADLQVKLRNALVNRIIHVASAVANPTAREYRNQILKIVKDRNMERFQQADDRVPDLDDVFCPVDLAPNPGDVPEGLLGDFPGENADKSALDALLDKREGMVVAVLGGPGSGKTALLDHTAQLICQASRRRRSQAIPLSATRIALSLDGGSRIQLPELLSQVFAGDEQVLSSWFTSRLEHGDCVILIDSFDEVADVGRRDRLARWIGRQSGKYPGNHYVIASRPREFQETKVRRAEVLSVCGLDSNQTYALLRSWSDAGTGRRRQRPSQDEINPRVSADELLDRVKQSAALNELAANPLVLSLIAVAGPMEAAITRWRVHVYRDVLGELLARRHLGIDSARALGAIAFTMLLQQKDKLVKAELAGVISGVLPDSGNADDILVQIATTGLLNQDGNGFFSFTHRVFCQYLGAAHIRAEGSVEIFAEHVEDAWWREATVLYASGAVLPDPQQAALPDGGDIDSIVTACLKSETVPALALAQDCKDSGGALSPRLRVQMESLFSPAVIIGSEPAKQAKMAKVMLMRLLDTAIPTEVGGKVCTGLVPRWLYTVLAPRDANVPDATCSPEAPLRGARGADAEGIVEWANNLLGQKAYRLPTPAEIGDPTIRRSLVASGGKTALWVWSRESQTAQPELVTVSGGNPYLVTGEDLARQIAADLDLSPAVTYGLLILRSIEAIAAIAGALAHCEPSEQIRGETLDLIHDLRRTLSLLLTAVPQVGGTLNSEDRDRLAACATDARSLRSMVRALKTTRMDPVQSNAERTADRLANELGKLAQCLLPVNAAWQVLGLPTGLPSRPGPGREQAPAQAFGESLTKVMAPSLARALSTALQRGTSANGWNADFAHLLCGQAGLSPKSPLGMPPDRLRDRAGEAIERTEELARSQDATPPVRLLRDVLTGSDVKDAIDGKISLASQAAAKCRLATVCTAAEASLLRNDDLAILLCDVAAGITVLERRADPRSRLPEGIVLAVV
jgi:hypothetical protein